MAILVGQFNLYWKRSPLDNCRHPGVASAQEEERPRKWPGKVLPRSEQRSENAQAFGKKAASFSTNTDWFGMCIQDGAGRECRFSRCSTDFLFHKFSRSVAILHFQAHPQWPGLSQELADRAGRRGSICFDGAVRRARSARVIGLSITAGRSSRAPCFFRCRATSVDDPPRYCASYMASSGRRRQSNAKRLFPVHNCGQAPRNQKSAAVGIGLRRKPAAGVGKQRKQGLSPPFFDTNSHRLRFLPPSECQSLRYFRFGWCTSKGSCSPACLGEKYLPDFSMTFHCVSASQFSSPHILRVMAAQDDLTPP